MRAEKALVKVDRDYVRYVRNMNIIKNSMDRASFFGRLAEQAKAEALAEAKHEMARKMKAMGDSSEKIHAITDIPIENIEQL